MDQQYSTPADVYGFGIVMWELATRLVPFSHKSAYNWAHNIEDDVCRGVRPPVDGVPGPFADLMQECWRQEAAERPLFERIVKVLGGGLDVSDTDVIVNLKKPVDLRRLDL